MPATKQKTVQSRMLRPANDMRAPAPATGAPGRPDRTDAVYVGLRRAIIEQALLPGTKLPEDAIGKAFEVSRTLARGALTRLAGEGLVELRRNRGAAVASPSITEAQDVFEIRRELENLVVTRLCGRLSAQETARLRAQVAKEHRAKGGHGPESIRLAGEFHILLAQMTGNALLARYVAELVSRSSLILALYARPHSSDCAVAEHLQLIEALGKGNPARARQLMKHHLGAVQGRAQITPKDGGEQALTSILVGYAAAVTREECEDR